MFSSPVEETPQVPGVCFHSWFPTSIPIPAFLHNLPFVKKVFPGLLLPLVYDIQPMPNSSRSAIASGCQECIGQRSRGIEIYTNILNSLLSTTKKNNNKGLLNLLFLSTFGRILFIQFW